jgi:hypothetical protein
MTNRPDDLNATATPRREFLGQSAASAVVLAGAACSTPAAAAQMATAAAPARGGVSSTQAWDDSWFSKLTARHKAVFDSPEVEENSTLGFNHAPRYIQGMYDALGATPRDVQTVVVVRHKSIGFAFNDAMWEKYAIGEIAKVKSGEAWATKNPVAHARANATNADRPQSNIEWMIAHNHFVLGCDLATQGLASQIADRTKGTMKTIYEELKANVVPGVILQPNGIYAVHRAQEAGCTFIRST